MNENIWKKVARRIVKAGGLPFPVSDTLVKICQLLIGEEEGKFIASHFRKSSMTLDQLVKESNMNVNTIKKILESLIDSGVAAPYPSTSTGENVYYLAGPVPGIFERVFMKGEKTEKYIKLAHLFEQYFKDIGDGYQRDYDNAMKIFKQFPPIYRIVPVEEEIKEHQELILPFEEVSKIVNKFDKIAVGTCYCRHQRELLDDPCKLNAPKKNCLFFGRTAQFFLDYDIAEEISKEEALEIVKEAEEYGLVHRAFHARQDITKDEFALCNCCKCCCEVFHSYYNGSLPMNSLTSYKAIVDIEKCIGCETCVEKCPMETIELIEIYAKVNEQKCIGCGVCAHNCAQGAIKLERTGPREVIVPIARRT